MLKILSRAFALTLFAAMILNPLPPDNLPAGQAAVPEAPAPLRDSLAGPAAEAPPAPAEQAALPLFRFPIVPGATVGGMFDHQSSARSIMFYDGRYNNPQAGYIFSCSTPYMNDWVGCQDAVAGEPACSNNRELWYDNHRGIDYEFSPNWHTGAFCDPGRFGGLTMPIYSPARGLVLMAGTDASRPGNGWHIRIKHDLNGNGNFNDDNIQSIYLHFTANSLAVRAGQIVEEGQYLGLGGSTGYSSTPHLHFEVQRSVDNFATTYWSVDPYGWQGPGNDPWPYTNVRLFRSPVTFTNFTYLPVIRHSVPQCSNCSELLNNGGFEAGQSVWVEQGTQLIVPAWEANLKVGPQQGNWLGWLGGINNTADALYQNFQVPNGTQEAVLTYYLNVVTTEQNGARDALYVNLRNTNGGLIRQLDYADNTFSPKSSWVQRSITFTELAPWQGQTLRLSFESTNNGSYQTSFHIDSVTLTATQP